jgi:hypothetical protein
MDRYDLVFDFLFEFPFFLPLASGSNAMLMEAVNLAQLIAALGSLDLGGSLAWAILTRFPFGFSSVAGSIL